MSVPPNEYQVSPDLPVPAPAARTLVAAPLSLAPMESEHRPIPWQRYFSALRRYRWLIVGVIILGTLGGMLISQRLSPTYMVQATILVEGRPDPQGPVRPDGLLERQGWLELMRSYAVLDTVVQRERLYVSSATRDSALFRTFAVDSVFRPGTYALEFDRSAGTYALSQTDGPMMDGGTLGDSIGRPLGFRWAPTLADMRHSDDNKLEFQVLSQREASLALGRSLTTNMAQQGNFVSILLRGSDPQRISRTLNTLLDHYVEVAADLKSHKLKETSRILRAQLDSIYAQLSNAESQLESYKTRIITLPNEATPIAPGLTSTQPTAITRFFDQKVRLDELAQHRNALETLVGEANAGRINPAAFQAIPIVQQSPPLLRALTSLNEAEANLMVLSQRFTNEARPVQLAQERIDSLRRGVIPAATRELLASVKRQEADLSGRVNAASRELQAIPQRMITEQRLERERTSLATIYTNVQERYQAARLAEASSIPDVRVHDRAIAPQRPATNSAPRIVALAFLSSLALAAVLAIALDHVDHRFRYPDQVTNDLGLTILGAVPRISRPRNGQADPEMTAQVVEAFRTVRLNLSHSYGSAGPVLLTVSSPQPGDGKSVISSNLALSFAEAGYRTLLVDGDTRRGELHRMFGFERVPGLLDCLAGDASREQVLRPTTHANLWLVPCGTRMQRGPELLSSLALREFIAAVKGQFNVIIFDSPPLGAGIDPFVLSATSGNLLLVLRTGETDRQLAGAKLELLARLPVRVLGAVLNDIRSTEPQYKYYAYSYGYTADEERPKVQIGSMLRG